MFKIEDDKSCVHVSYISKRDPDIRYATRVGTKNLKKKRRKKN